MAWIPTVLLIMTALVEVQYLELCFQVPEHIPHLSPKTHGGISNSVHALPFTRKLEARWSYAYAVSVFV